tara:strand:+ start:1492 stop:1707 length:216 start_codon:yes stop_codon:yes gene_type:complete
MCAPMMPSSKMNKNLVKPNSAGGSLISLVRNSQTAQREALSRNQDVVKKKVKKSITPINKSVGYGVGLNIK